MWLIPSPLARSIVRSLRSEPERWNRLRDRDISRRDDGLAIWHGDLSYRMYSDDIGIGFGANAVPQRRDGNLRPRDSKHIWRAFRAIWDRDQATLRANIAYRIGAEAR